MNPITNMKNLNKMNEREIEMGVAGTHKSWHNQVRSFGILIFKDESYFYVFFPFSSTRTRLGYLLEDCLMTSQKVTLFVSFLNVERLSTLIWSVTRKLAKAKALLSFATKISAQLYWP